MEACKHPLPIIHKPGPQAIFRQQEKEDGKPLKFVRDMWYNSPANHLLSLRLSSLYFAIEM